MGAEVGRTLAVLGSGLRRIHPKQNQELAAVVVEANLRSGSVNAGGRARRQGRLLLVVPGSPGTDSLIVEGAEAIDPDKVDFDQLTRRIINETAEGETSAQLSLF